MNRRRVSTTIVSALLATAAATYTSAAAPPPSVSVRQLVAAASEAAGGPLWSGVAGLEERGTERSNALTGRFLAYTNLRTGDYLQSTDFGIFRVGESYAGGSRMKMDRSGGLHRLDGAFAQRRARTEAWLSRRGYLQTQASVVWGAVERRLDKGRAFDLVTATPEGGQPVELWFDAGTHLLDRAVRVDPISISVVAYSDYRRTGGLMLPYRLASGDETSQEDIIEVSSYQIDHAPRPVPSLIAPQDADLTAATTIPIEFDGDIFLDAVVNGLPMSFLLDTGGHDILTPEAAERLGLVPVGEGLSGGTGEGKLREQDVRVKTLAIGAATLRDQHFFVLPLQYGTVERGALPALAGILGLEIFERFGVSIDLVGGTLTVQRSDAALRCGGTEVPIVFDDDIPLVDGRIDGKEGLIAIDTGNSGGLIVQGKWAKRVGLEHAMRSGSEGVGFGSGGVSRNWRSSGHALEIGDARIGPLDVSYYDDKSGSFSSMTEAGNAGTSVLARYVVDFDYARGRMCLVARPGYTPPPRSRLGAGVQKTGPDAFNVVQITKGSPAAAADIRQGDRIVRIDGREASLMSGFEFGRVVRRPAGTWLQLDLIREGVAIHKMVELRDP